MKRTAIISFVICAVASLAASQRLAVLEPRSDTAVPSFKDELRSALAQKTKLIDQGLAASAYSSVEIEDPFNMTSEDAKRVGSVIGCDRFLIVRSAVQRRAAGSGRSYFEAYALAYLVDARTGLLIRFEVLSTEADAEQQAAQRLIAKVPNLAAAILEAKPGPARSGAAFPEPPPENSPQAAGLKLPVPYKRVRPEYTPLAALYGVKATVDIQVDIDTDGGVSATRVTRWAGFGLDEAVEKAVRSMNWRPAMQNGKALPMRVLLRYNFKKFEKDEEP